MKRMALLLFVSLFAFSLTLTSCKKDEKVVGSKTCVEAAEEWSTAVQNFGFNPSANTESECEAWKAAWLSFTDKCNIKSYLSDEEYDEYINKFNELDCSDFQ